jgi:hypothetical protein
MTAAIFTTGKVVPLTKADGVVITTPRALYIGTPGTLNFVDEHGNLCENFPAQAGELRIRITQLREGGDATDIWGFY